MSDLEKAVETLIWGRGYNYAALDQVAWDFLAEEVDGEERQRFIAYLDERLPISHGKALE